METSNNLVNADSTK